jgi:hypothetical protein
MKPLLLAAFFAGSLAAANAPPGSTEESAPINTSRVTETIDGIACDYAPADALIVRALAPLIAVQNHDAAQSGPTALTPTAGAPAVPLSIADFRRNRADYLTRIAVSIGLEKPTTLQEDCYDGYLDNFERTEQALALMMEHARAAFEIRTITLVHRTDLMRRLKAGEKIPGFTLDPDGEHGTATWKPPEVNGRDERLVSLLKQREQRRLDLSYNYSTKDGVIDFSARTKIGRPADPPPVEPPPAPSNATSPVAPPFPFIVMLEQENLPPEEIAAQLAKGMNEVFGSMRNFRPASFQDSAVLANLLLHETTEIGIVEHYLGSRDRRWLCEGMANHTAWKIARDRAGEAAARQIYDVQAQLAQYAALREKIDLQKWPATENQRKEDADTPLTRAHYAYAARAVFLIAERHGGDFLPRLFREIGRTPRQKTDMRTVEKAYKKLAGENLSVVLAAAVAPETPAKVRPATG